MSDGDLVELGVGIVVDILLLVRHVVAKGRERMAHLIGLGRFERIGLRHGLGLGRDQTQHGANPFEDGKGFFVARGGLDNDRVREVLMQSVHKALEGDAEGPGRSAVRVLALGGYGEAAAPAVDALTRCLEEGGDEALLTDAVMALAAVGLPAEPALPVLRRVAASAQGDLGLQARGAVLRIEAAGRPGMITPGRSSTTPPTEEADEDGG